jgi:hypothetical protein
MKEEDRILVKFGDKETSKNPPPKEFVRDLLFYVLSPRVVKYSSDDGIREAFRACLEEGVSYCHLIYSHPPLGISRSGITLFIKRLERALHHYEKHSKYDIQAYCWDLALVVDGLGPLRNFGIGNLLGDRLVGDPEKISIREAKSFIGW